MSLFYSELEYHLSTASIFKWLSDFHIFSTESRLSRAISGFQSRLSSEAKAEFRKLRFHTRQNRPSDRDVYSLLRELDRKVAQTEWYKPAYQPYLISLLQSVQQFAAIDDDIDDNNRKVFNCDVWTVVEFCLRYAVLHWTALSDIAHILMEVGQSAPRYQSLAAYYLDSEGVRRSIDESFILVVKLCSNIYDFTSRIAADKSFIDIDLVYRSKYEKLKAWAESVPLEILKLTAADDRVLSKAHKLDSKALAAQQRKLTRQYQWNKNHVLEIISQSNVETCWRHIRKETTTESFLQNSSYQDWKRKKTSATLICTGKRAVGKSVMLANMIDDLRLADHDSIVTYFFYTLDGPNSSAHYTILNSFVRQLLEALPLEAFTERQYIFGAEDNDALFALLKPHLSKAKPTKVFFVLDGLYECPEDSRNQVFQFLHRLQVEFPLLLCMSDVEGSAQFRGNRNHSLLLPLNISRMSITINPLEMKKFVGWQIRHCIDYGLPISLNWLNGHETTTISLLSETSYVFARLYLLYVGEIQEDAKSLAELSQDPSDLLKEVIQHGVLEHDILQLLIELTMTAIHPLTLDQLREAYIIDTYIRKVYPTPFYRPPCYTLDYYRGFFTIDDEDSTIHMSHRSALKELLESSTNKAIDISTAHQKMAKLCLVSLTDESPQMATFIQEHTSRTSNTKQHVPSLQRHWKPLFKQYAIQHWLKHFVYVPAENTSTIDLARTYFSQQNISTYHPDGLPLVEWALAGSHTIILSLAIKSLHPDILHTCHSLIIHACLSNNLHYLKTLTSLHTFSLNTLYHNSRPLLSLVIELNNTEIAWHLIQSGCTVIDHFDSAHRSTLWHAARDGNVERVKMILATGLADVNTRDVYAMTPLAAAVMGRHVAVVETLLKDPAVNTRTLDDDNRTPLMTAEVYGFEEMVGLLRAFEERMHVGMMEGGNIKVVDVS